MRSSGSTSQSTCRSVRRRPGNADHRLRQIACLPAATADPVLSLASSDRLNRLVDLHRLHVKASKRSVKREEELEMALSKRTPRHQLARKLLANGLGPAEGAMREELRRRMKTALARLPASYRTVLVMRQLERLSTSEIAAALGIAEGTVKSRHFRALERIRVLLNEEP